MGQSAARAVEAAGRRDVGTGGTAVTGSITSFDSDKHYLGRLCTRGHDWQGTGKSLRARGYRDCVECARFRAHLYSLAKWMAMPVTNAKQLAFPLFGKVCKTCGETKSFTDFPKSQAARDGHGSHCKVCERPRYKVDYRKRVTPQYLEDAAIRARASYRSHPDATKRYVKEWAHRKPERKRAISQKYRARKFAAEGSFTAEEWQGLCAQYDHRCLACGENKPLSADHIVPLSKGGTNYITNIQPLCGSCNTRKNAKTIDYRP